MVLSLGSQRDFSSSIYPNKLAIIVINTVSAHVCKADSFYSSAWTWLFLRGLSLKGFLVVLTWKGLSLHRRSLLHGLHMSRHIVAMPLLRLLLWCCTQCSLLSKPKVSRGCVLHRKLYLLDKGQVILQSSYHTRGSNRLMMLSLMIPFENVLPKSHRCAQGDSVDEETSAEGV